MILTLLLAGWMFVLVLVCALCVAARRGELGSPVVEVGERHLWAATEPEITARYRVHETVSAEASGPLVHAGNAAA